MTTPDDDCGIVRLASRHGVADTIDRLARGVAERGLIVFARIDFSGDAARAGLAMRAEQMLIFGNPKAGTALMQAEPVAGLDLPLKALAWEDADGRTWLAYNAPAYIIRRHKLSPEFTTALGAATALLENAVA